jgi:hypothetical protein
VSVANLQDGTYEYEITFLPGFFFPVSLERNLTVVVSNQSGIGELNTDFTPPAPPVPPVALAPVPAPAPPAL